MATLEKKIALNGVLKILTGIHVGDSKENVQIGGVDATVVRRKDNNQPYIPGSSIKGKIRSLLEQAAGAPEVGGGMKRINEKGDKVDYKFAEKSLRVKEIISLFGFANDDIPSKLIVRDAYLTEGSAKELEKSPYTDYPFTEVKFENTIDRIKGSAGNPRKIERVPVGAEFKLEFIINKWSGDDESKLIELLKDGILLLEADYLGGSGSRGYGQVKVEMDFSSPITLYPKPSTHA